MTCKIVPISSKEDKEELTLRQAVEKYIANTPKKFLDKKVEDIVLIFQVNGEVQYITLYDDSDLEYVGLLELVKNMILSPYGLTFESD